MRRLLILVLSLAIAGTALSAPAYACAAMTSAIASNGHTCCDEPALTTAPAGLCCVVSAPVRIVSTESRQPAPDRHLVVVLRTHAGGPPQHDHAPHASPPVQRSASVAIYLQQLSLLI